MLSLLPGLLLNIFLLTSAHSWITSPNSRIAMAEVVGTLFFASTNTLNPLSAYYRGRPATASKCNSK